MSDLWPAPRPSDPVDRVVSLPGSKSLTNRALVLAAMCMALVLVIATPVGLVLAALIAWSDWASEPKVGRDFGIRLDTNYYYWPGSWVQNRPGMFTGSGAPTGSTPSMSDEAPQARRICPVAGWWVLQPLRAAEALGDELLGVLGLHAEAAGQFAAGPLARHLQQRQQAQQPGRITHVRQSRSELGPEPSYMGRTVVLTATKGMD